MEVISMTNPQDKLRKAVFAELEAQRQRPPKPYSPHREKLLGDFLRACLSNLKRSSTDFARALDIEQELADAILEGLLPVSEIDDEFLAEIAAAVDYEPGVLRALVGRTVSGSSKAESDFGSYDEAKKGPNRK
jgi:hypothetical protein